MKRSLLAVLCVSGVLAGCGGGQGSNASDSSQVHTTSLGQGVVTYSGRILPAATYSLGGVTTVAMAGATFSKVYLSPAQNAQNSLITFDMGGQIWTYQNGVETQITHGVLGARNPSTSKTGLIAFCGLDGATNFYQIYTCNFDGSGLKRVTSSSFNKNVPSWSPSGTKIAFENADTENLYTVNADGSGEAPLTITGASLGVDSFSNAAWSPDGSKIAFDDFDTVKGHYEVYVVASSGGTATEVTSGYSTNCFAPAWSPDGTELAIQVAQNSSSQIDVVNVQYGSRAEVAVPPSGTGYYTPHFSPDGNSVAFDALTGSNLVIDTQLLGNVGNPTTIITSASSTAWAGIPYWSSYFGTKTFIGSGGQMATAAGFIWSQLGDGFGSFVSISATTPSKLTITQQSPGTSGSPSVFLAKADAVTKIVYSNSYYGALTAITPTGSTQALISISTTSGQVDAIGPLAEPATLSSAAANRLAYDGKFTALYDAKGKNMAPAGASHVEFDKRTGALASWR
ncbi:MAG TPA: hypothetical protein VG944_23840 [Fimbriimonas sp.]|nr:hypothetical protein [Fimbriimonas sp.]